MRVVVVGFVGLVKRSVVAFVLEGGVSQTLGERGMEAAGGATAVLRRGRGLCSRV